MKLQVKGCGNCGFCYLIWREWFYRSGDEGVRARDVEIPEDQMEEVRRAIAQCPTQAISICS